MISKYKELENGIAFFLISTDQLKVKVTNLGGHILSVLVRDKNGEEKDMVLGYENVEDCHRDGSYMGAVVGRVANRIGGAEFDLNGITYSLNANNGPNHLHGGNVGFDQKLFRAKILEDKLCLSYTSPDGEEGYPGTLDLKVTYEVVGDTLSVEYEAVCDQDTIANFTNHMYFNLSGMRENILHHKLKIDAKKIVCVDENCLANGEFLEVENTPFDFCSFREIGEHIHDGHEQLKNAGGYDHSYLLEGKDAKVILIHGESGRKLVVTTTMPVAHIYTGNFLAGGCNGKEGKPYENYDGVAIETQLLPNSIHIEKDPSVILRKGEKFCAKTCYQFCEY